MTEQDQPVIQKRPIIRLRIRDDGSPAYIVFVRTEEVAPGREPRSLGNEAILELDEWGAKHLHLQLSNALAFRGGLSWYPLGELGRYKLLGTNLKGEENGGDKHQH